MSTCTARLRRHIKLAHFRSPCASIGKADILPTIDTNKKFYKIRLTSKVKEDGEMQIFSMFGSNR